MGEKGVQAVVLTSCARLALSPRAMKETAKALGIAGLHAELSWIEEMQGVFSTKKEA